MEIILTNPLFYAMVIFVISAICGIFGAICAIYAVIEVKALQRSTHQIQYVPIDPKVDAENTEWATSDAALNQQNKLFAEDIEDSLEPFSPDDDDKARYSF